MSTGITSVKTSSFKETTMHNDLFHKDQENYNTFFSICWFVYTIDYFTYKERSDNDSLD